MKRLKVLISAYACEPGKGSEPGVGWNIAKEMSRHHDVWVMTRANNRQVIQEELAHSPMPHLHFLYFDLPRWARWWKRGGRGTRIYYYLWQVGMYFRARAVHKVERFDIAHHVTFVNYWTPSLLALLPVPFVWGPVGGGEDTPTTFLKDLSRSGQHYEQLRKTARALSEMDPLVRLTARRSAVALATTDDTARRQVALGARKVSVLPEVAMHIESGTHDYKVCVEDTDPAIFISIGRLIHWKGFHLGLRALAASSLTDAHYWLIGDGPERARLGELVAELGLSERVRFLGQIPRHEVLERLRHSTALVHPSLHDSGGWVSLEAMAVGKPVICLDLGGPALQVTSETGIKVPAVSPADAVMRLASAMEYLAQDASLRRKMGEAGRNRISTVFSWERRGEALDTIYREACASRKAFDEGNRDQSFGAK